ncbi:MAG: hypothetical protein AAF740_05785 [Bacteroidota bacterium]
MLMYQNEENRIEEARKTLEAKALSQEELWKEYEELLESYEGLLKEIKVLNRISDRQINKNIDKDRKK